MQQKTAVGLFHFNVHYVSGEIDMYHRYCVEAVQPFLEWCAAQNDISLNAEMSGRSLEFISEHYPHTIKLLRDLVEQRKVELISSTYSASIWPAFPARDLIRSVEINAKVLQKLGLKASRIFFSQEAFFGSGLKSVEKYFDLAVCKDEYLIYNGIPKPDAKYRLGRMDVLVARNHLIHSLRERYLDDEENAISPGIKEILASAGSRLPVDNAPDSYSRIHWVHCGSGHHFCTYRNPLDSQNFYYDPEWCHAVSMHLQSLKDASFRICTLSEAAKHIANIRASDLPIVVEAGWNTERSKGIFQWMGFDPSGWEDDTGILGRTWRARHALRECEELLATIDVTESDRFAEALEDQWRLQLTAEASDPLGWHPTPEEVFSGRAAADLSLRSAEALRYRICTARLPPVARVKQRDRVGTPVRGLDIPTTVRANGGARFTTFQNHSKEWVVEVTLPQGSLSCGITFGPYDQEVRYCPSGLEQELTVIDLDRFPNDNIYLPLANGLISIGQNLYIIRDNLKGQSAARVDKRDRTINFEIQRTKPLKHSHQWRFVILSCAPPRLALTRANELNSC